MAATERRLGVTLALVGLAFWPAAAGADEASGTVTGRVEVRGSYYWERSTRVVAPTVAGRLETPRGVTIDGTYLVDSITSASVAAGALVDTGFTEIRHDVTMSVAGEVAAGPHRLAIQLGGHGSREPDYHSGSGTVGLRLLLDERTTTVGFTLTAAHDEVRQVFRVGSQIRPPNLGGSVTNFHEDFDSLVLSFSGEHVVNRNLVVGASYDLGHMRGYLSSPYRQVQVDGVLETESHPGLRIRHTLTLRGSYAIAAAHGALHATVRGYADSWSIHAVTTDLRYYQEIGDALLLRLHHRFYTQSAAFFDSGLLRPIYSNGPRYYTADPKMQAFHSQELGVAWVVRLGFLASSRLGFFRDAELEFSADYRFSTNRFGNAVIAASSLRIPF